MLTVIAANARPVATGGGDPVAGAQVFHRCAACHSVTPGAPSGIGPNLSGVVGRRAGSLPKYQYSNAMRSSGLIWTRDNIDRFLAAPRTVVPGTKMPFAGLSNAQDRSNITAYLSGAKK